MSQYRQGDVMLIRMAKAPARAVAVRRRGGKVVLARGEQTGHAHVIESDVAQLLEDVTGKRFLILTRTERLVHEEHAPVDVPPGIYQVLQQREYVAPQRSAADRTAGARTRAVRD